MTDDLEKNAFMCSKKLAPIDEAMRRLAKLSPNRASRLFVRCLGSLHQAAHDYSHELAVPKMNTLGPKLLDMS